MIADIQVLPSPTGTADSEFAHVEAAIAVIAESGLSHSVNALGTTIEGPPERVWATARAAFDACLASGADKEMMYLKLYQGSTSVERLETSGRSVAAAAAVAAALEGFDVAFIRHGNTAKAAVDSERELTDLGREQAAEACAGYVKSLPAPVAALALSSPAVRCTDTLRRVLAHHPRVLIEPLEVIYSESLQPEGSALFAKLSYAPLAAYHAESATSKDYLDGYADKVLFAAAEAVRSHPVLAQGGRTYTHGTDRQRSTLCIGGHAIYNNAVALRLADLRGHSADDLETIKNYNVAECCGFLVGEAESQMLKI